MKRCIVGSAFIACAFITKWRKNVFALDNKIKKWFFPFFILYCARLIVPLQKEFEKMTELHKKYRFTSTEEPTDEMLQALMEDVAAAARESSAKAEAEKKRMLSEAAHVISIKRAQREQVAYDWQKTHIMCGGWP